MPFHCCNLNIHYSVPKEIWNKLSHMYADMPNWIGFIDNIPFWYGNEASDNYICASVEPSGLQISANLSDDEWSKWMELFKRRATEILEYEVGEPEEGYAFKYF